MYQRAVVAAARRGRRDNKGSSIKEEEGAPSATEAAALELGFVELAATRHTQPSRKLENGSQTEKK